MLWGKNERPDEYDLMKLPFKQVFAFRQGAMKYVDCQTNLSRMNKVFIRLYPASKTLFPNTANTVTQLGQVIIYAAPKDYKKKIVELSDIKILADRAVKQL